MQKSRHCFRFSICVIVLGFFLLSPQAVSFAVIEFDKQKLEALQDLQTQILDESSTTPTEEDSEAVIHTPKAPPSQKGVIRVKDDQVATSAEVYREQLKILSKEEKTLLERISMDIHADINYDSNVFSEKKPRGDIYYSVGPGIRLDATDLYKGLGFHLNYSGSWVQYASFARLNRFDHNLNLDIPGKGKKIRIGKKLTVELRAGLQVSGDDDTSSADPGIFARRVEPIAGLTANYLISKKFSTDFSYDWHSRKSTGTAEAADGESTEVAEDLTVQEHLKYHITPKTRIFSGVGYGFSTGSGGDGDEASDAFNSKYVEIFGGIEGRITRKSVVSLEAGWEWRTFDARSSESGFHVQAAYLVRLNRKWSAQLFLIQDQELSSRADVGIINTYRTRASLRYRPTNKLSWQIGSAYIYFNTSSF